ncbi:MAG: helix-turn-helix domain-containing protein [Bacteroidota bacterium]|nr:helix-turn-helix domain-containing protein [Bacteroidota bacterium]
MKTITILVLETAVPAAIVDPRYMFSAVNEFFKSSGHQPFFKIQLASVNKQVKLLDGSLIIKPDIILKDIKKTDLVIIPAISGDIKIALKKNKEIIEWIKQQYKKGAEVASLCIGAFVLASTGLLNGKMCSTHWLFANDFKTMFPEVKLVDDKVVTDQNGLYSSGGASSYWSLLLYIVEKYTSRDMAIMASKFFMLDISLKSQAPFMLFRGQKEHNDSEVKSIQRYIEENYGKKLTVGDLVTKNGIGRRTLERRFKKATSNSVIEYIQRVRVEAAKKMLEVDRKNVTEVMYAVGYSDNKAFRDIFKKITDMSPVDYRLKYSKQIIK